MNDSCWRAQPTGQGALGCIGKQTEQAMRTKPVSTPSGLCLSTCLPVPTLSSYPDFLMTDCDVEV